MTEAYADLGGQPTDLETESLRHQFGAALPISVRLRVHPTAAIDSALKRAISNGWTVAELAREASRDLGTAENVGAIVTNRLLNCASLPKLQHKKSPLPPWCGQCSDTAFRWEVDAEDLPVKPCPRCSPKAT